MFQLKGFLCSVHKEKIILELKQRVINLPVCIKPMANADVYTALHVDIHMNETIMPLCGAGRSLFTANPNL